MRVLIVKMWALGDILMATPILASLKKQFPNCRISWITDKFYADVLRNNPHLDELIEIDSGDWTRKFRRGDFVRFYRESTAMRADLAKRNFDVVINLTPEKWWTVWMLAAPRRIGLYPGRRPTWTSRWYTDVLTRHETGDSALHNTDHYLLTARELGCDDPDFHMSIGETPDEEVFLSEFRIRHSLLADRLTVVLAPFATTANRCWEPERLAELSDWLHDKYGAQVILTLAPRNREEAAAIARRAKSGKLVVAEGTSIRESIALMRWADLTVCVDSAPMHIAGALGKPFVALFGPTPVDQRLPLVGHGTAIAKSLPCAPCDLPTCSQRVFRQCMKLISVDEVKGAVAAKLAGVGVPANSDL